MAQYMIHVHVTLILRWSVTSLCVYARTRTCRFTYEIAPVFTLMEEIVLTKMRECVGWSGGDGDGIFAPGTTSIGVFSTQTANNLCVLGPVR